MHRTSMTSYCSFVFVIRPTDWTLESLNFIQNHWIVEIRGNILLQRYCECFVQSSIMLLGRQVLRVSKLQCSISVSVSEDSRCRYKLSRENLPDRATERLTARSIIALGMRKLVVASLAMLNLVLLTVNISWWGGAGRIDGLCTDWIPTD